MKVSIFTAKGTSQPGSPSHLIYDAQKEPRAPLSTVWDSEPRSCVPQKGEYARQILNRIWHNMISAWGSTLITILTVSVLVLGILCLFGVVSAGRSLLSNSQQEVKLSAFLVEQAQDSQVAALIDQLKRDPQVEAVAVLGKEQALRELGQSLGEGKELVAGLVDRNPLPDMLEVKLKREAASETNFARIASTLNSVPIVSEVHYSQEIVRSFSKILAAGQNVSLLILAVAMIVAGFIVWNTIYLALNLHREEIEILRLLGATYTDISLPYLLEGLIQGLAGASIALALLWSGALILPGFFGDSWLTVAPVYQSFKPGFLAALLALVVSGLLGTMGSLLALRRFLIF